jgi:hypothetical protein
MNNSGDILRFASGVAGLRRPRGGRFGRLTRENNSGDILRFASGVAGLRRPRGGRFGRLTRDFVASPGGRRS